MQSGECKCFGFIFLVLLVYFLSSRTSLFETKPLFKCICVYSDDIDVLSKDSRYISLESSCDIDGKIKMVPAHVYSPDQKDFTHEFLVSRLNSKEDCFLETSYKELLYKRPNTKAIKAYTPEHIDRNKELTNNHNFSLSLLLTYIFIILILPIIKFVTIR